MLAKKLSMTLNLDGVPRYFCIRYCPPLGLLLFAYQLDLLFFYQGELVWSEEPTSIRSLQFCLKKKKF